MSIIALIPARSGSKRIPGKNIKDFFGHPLMSYTIQVAKDCGLFDGIYVSSDSPEYLETAEWYGAQAVKRPDSLSDGNQATIAWVTHIFSSIGGVNSTDIFVILRPTSPFRTSETIKKAVKGLTEDIDSMRAVRLCREHPLKMWRIYEDESPNLVPVGRSVNPIFFDVPYKPYDKPYQLLPEVYIQSGMLEVAWARTPLLEGSTSGDNIYPIFAPDIEHFDLNYTEDWILAEELVKRGMAKLPEVK